MLLKALRSVRKTHQADDMPLEFTGGAPKPERPFYAIGDIHGRADLIEPLLEKIDIDMEARGISDPVLVFLGDYVDRGDATADVLAHIYELSEKMPDNVVTLMGNHERMMLDFIDDPAGKGKLWLRHGGVQTLHSFGIEGVTAESDMGDIIDASAGLILTFSEEMELWLRNLPLIWRSGNVSCVHAGMNPLVSPNGQSAQTLLWGHADFSHVTRLDGHWVVHGHTVVEKPHVQYGRISIDTGAWYTGCLTAVAITGDEPRFL